MPNEENFSIFEKMLEEEHKKLADVSNLEKENKRKLEQAHSRYEIELYYPRVIESNHYDEVMIKEMIRDLEALKGYEKYVRIAAMSDVEVEEWKKTKIAELDAHPYGNEYYYEERQKLVNGSIDEIRANLLEEAQKENSFFFSTTVKKYNGKRKPPRIYSNVYFKLELAKKLSGLLKYYEEQIDSKISNLPQSVEAKELPVALKDELPGRGLDGRVSVNISDEQKAKIIEIIEKFKQKFAQEKELYKSEFTMAKMMPLVQAGTVQVPIEMPFLETHKNKVPPELYEELKILIEKRNKLSKKIIKTSSIKYELQEVNQKIAEKQVEAYNEITNWYRNNSHNNILGTYSKISFENMEQFRESVQKKDQQIEQSEKSMQKFISDIPTAQKEYEDKKTAILSTKDEYIKPISELIGRPVTQEEIDECFKYGIDISSIQTSNNEEKIQQALETIRKKAQAEADAKAEEIYKKRENEESSEKSR